MRLKYIEEKFGFFFEFGKYENGDVGISSEDNPDICRCTPEQAKWLCNNHAAMNDMIFELFNALYKIDPAAANKVYYGK